MTWNQSLEAITVELEKEHTACPCLPYEQWKARLCSDYPSCENCVRYLPGNGLDTCGIFSAVFWRAYVQASFEEKGNNADSD